MKFIQAVRQLQRHYEGKRELTEQQLETSWSYITRPSLPVISTLPFDELPRHLRRHKAMKRYSLGDCVENSDVAINLSLDVRTCSIAMQFKAVLNRSSPHYMDSSAIYMNNELVGILKQYEHPAFLALATVTDGRRYPLVKGGVYAVHQDVRRQCEKQGRHHSLDLEALTVRPKRMLYRQTRDVQDFLRHIRGARRKVLRERT